MPPGWKPKQNPVKILEFSILYAGRQRSKPESRKYQSNPETTSIIQKWSPKTLETSENKAAMGQKIKVMGTEQRQDVCSETKLTKMEPTQHITGNTTLKLQLRDSEPMSDLNLTTTAVMSEQIYFTGRIYRWMMSSPWCYVLEVT